MKKSLLEKIFASFLFAAIVLPICAVAQVPSAESFVQNAAIGGMFEIRSSQIALDRSTNTEVLKFARMMIDDHTKISDELKSKLSSTSVKDMEIPKTLDQKHQDVIAQLKNAPPSAFDNLYLRDQVDAHQEAFKLFNSYARSGDDQTLKTFAIENLPTIKSHLSRVKTLQLSE